MGYRYLVTGGAGFIGAAVTRTLLRAGHDVRILDDTSRGTLQRLEDIRDEIEIVQADVRDQAAVTEATDAIDRVIHLAHVNGTELFYREPERVLDVGIRGMLSVIDACRDNGVPELLVASSSEVYQNPPRLPTDESVPLTIPDVTNPRYSYAGSKALSELITLHYGLTGFDRVVVFRPHNVYGPDMGWEHVIPQLTVKAVRSAAQSSDNVVELTIQGDGSQTRAFMFVDDCAEAILHLADHGEHRTIYHVGNPEEVSVRALAEAICRSLGYEADVLPGASAPGSPDRRCPDITRLRETGFEPSTPLTRGLPPTVGWYVDHISEAPW